MLKILILQGPNLNRLGKREPGHYGTKTLSEIHEEIEALGKKENFLPVFFQSNHEGAIVDRIHAAGEEVSTCQNREGQGSSGRSGYRESSG